MNSKLKSPYYLTKILSLFCASIVSFSSIGGLPAYAAEKNIGSQTSASATISLISKQQGCSFNLYNMDGSLKAESITTNSQGVADIDGLTIGEYYIREIAAPSGTRLNTSKKPFSVRQEDYGRTINLSVETPDISQTIFVTCKAKTSNINFENGNPILNFEAKNTTTGDSYYTHINISKNSDIDSSGYYEYISCFGNLPVGTYTVSSLKGLRFTSQTDTVALSQNQNAACSFTLESINLSECSDSQNEESILSTEKIPVSIIVNNPHENAYKAIDRSGMTATIMYSNGTCKTVSANDNNPNIRFLNTAISSKDVGTTIYPSIEYIENGIAISKQFPVCVKKWPSSLAVSTSQDNFEVGQIDKSKLSGIITFCDGSTASINGSQMSLNPDAFTSDDIKKTVSFTASYSENGTVVSCPVSLTCINSPTSMAIGLSKGAVSNGTLDTSKITATIFYHDGSSRIIQGSNLSYSQTSFPDSSKTYNVTASYTESGKQLDSVFIISNSEVCGKVISSSNNEAVPSVSVSFNKYSSSTNAYNDQTIQTSGNTNGEYDTFVSHGKYKITYSATGYLPLTTYQEIESDGLVALETVSLIPANSSDSTTTFSVSGTTTNAIDHSAISGAAISYRQGWNTKTGAHVFTNVSSDASGKFTSSLPAGYYTAEISKGGFITGYFNISVLNNSTSSINATLSPILAANEYRIVLTWGAKPRDLDSHLFIRKVNSSPEKEIFYQNKTWNNSGDSGTENLDIDNTQGFGPETITIKTESNLYEYDFAVYNYSNEDALNLSNAQVKIYNGNSLLASYSVPTNQSGRTWNVFKLVNGAVVPINTLTSASPIAF